jgi:hypothetical protein
MGFEDAKTALTKLAAENLCRLLEDIGYTYASLCIHKMK